MAGGSQETLTKGARITGDQRSSLARTFGERYAAGESIRSIAQDTGRSYGFVHGVLKESGASLRGRGGATRGPRVGALDQLAGEVEAAVDGVASAVRTKAKASRSTKAAAQKNGRVKAAKTAKPVKALKDDRPKKKDEARKDEAKKAGKKGKKG